MKTNIPFWSYLAQFSLEREMFQSKVCRENQNTHFVFSNFSFPILFSKIVPFIG